MTPDEGCKTKLTLPGRSQGSESREKAQMGITVMCLEYPGRD